MLDTILIAENKTDNPNNKQTRSVIRCNKVKDALEKNIAGEENRQHWRNTYLNKWSGKVLRKIRCAAVLEKHVLQHF